MTWRATIYTVYQPILGRPQIDHSDQFQRKLDLAAGTVTFVGIQILDPRLGTVGIASRASVNRFKRASGMHVSPCFLSFRRRCYPSVNERKCRSEAIVSALHSFQEPANSGSLG